MNKILIINTDDIIINPEEQSDMINNACNHNIKMNVTGVCQSGDYVLIALEENDPVQDLTYILAPLNAENLDDITAEISTRYFAGFSTIGGFEVKAEKWALFATPTPPST